MNPDDIKQIQLRLQQKGLYTGPIDGVMGGATQSAMQREAAWDAANAGRLRKQQEFEAGQRRKNEEVKAELERKKTEAEARIAERKAALKELDPQLQTLLSGVDPKDWKPIIDEFNKSKEAAEQRKAQIETEATAAGIAGGFGTGIAADKFGRKQFGKTLEARNRELESAAGRSRMAMAMKPGPIRDAALQGVVKTAEEQSLGARRFPVGRAATAGIMVPFGLYSSLYRAPEAKSDYERAMWTGTGYGELAAGGKLLAGAVNDRWNPPVALNTGALADIEAAKAILKEGTPKANNYKPLPPGGTPPRGPVAPPTPPPGPERLTIDVSELKGQRKEVLKTIAQHEGLETSGTAEQLSSRIRNHAKTLDAAGQNRIATWLGATPAEGESVGRAITRRIASMPGRVSGLTVGLMAAGADLGVSSGRSAAKAAGLEDTAADIAAPVAGGITGLAGGYGVAKGGSALGSALAEASPFLSRAGTVASRALGPVSVGMLAHDFLGQARPGDFLEPSLPTEEDRIAERAALETPEQQQRYGQILENLQSYSRNPDNAPRGSVLNLDGNALAAPMSPSAGNALSGISMAPEAGFASSNALAGPTLSRAQNALEGAGSDAEFEAALGDFIKTVQALGLGQQRAMAAPMGGAY